MHVGILTAPLRTQPLAELIPWAAAQGIRALEIDVRSGAQLSALTVDDAALEQLQGLLSAHKVQISSLACYALLTGVTAKQAAQSRKEIDAAIKLAARLGVGTVCTLAGFPSPGKNKAKTIAEDLPGAMRPLLDLAGQHGVKLALPLSDQKLRASVPFRSVSFSDLLPLHPRPGRELRGCGR